MSRNVVLRCACGRARFDGFSWFTSLVWDDILGCLEALGIENPYHDLPFEGLQVDGAGFRAWWDDAAARMRAARESLPVIYCVWQEQGTDAGYCVCRGRGWMVEGIFDELLAVPLAPVVWESRRAGLTYAPPVVEEAAPEIVPRFPSPADGARVEVALAADEFERVFRGTPVTLEHGRLPDYFAAELRAMDELARHSDERGETILILGY
ncbi:MAG TPA: hypothetical protein VF092_10945 [Longimicrobium sp.]